MSSQKTLIFKVRGSKSYANRALLLASLSHGKVILKNLLFSEDTLYMIKALKSLGVSITNLGGSVQQVSKESTTVHGKSGKFDKPKNPIFIGNSGTCMRFLTAALAAQNFSSTIDASERMRCRPIGALVDALRQLGAQIIYLKKDGYPPLRIKGPLKGKKCVVKGDISSQFISALLMSAPMGFSNITVNVAGKILSKPYIDMTISAMKDFGVLVKREGYRKFIISNKQKPRKKNYLIESDISSASYFWGIAAVAGTKICVENINPNSTQADLQFLRMLKRMGCLMSLRDPPKTDRSNSCVCIAGPLELKPLGKVNLSDMPDSALTLAVICAFAKGKSELRGLENLKYKECDRLEAVKNGLVKIGCPVKKLNDGLIIYGNPEGLRGARIETYGDHRIAMSFSVAKSVITAIKIKNPMCVKKTYPNFWDDFKKTISQKNIVLTGLRACGKTKLGRILAKKMRRKFYDLDSMIEKKAGKSIGALVRERGWVYFRKLERDLVKKFHGVANSVIATGGGALTSEENFQILRKNSFIVFLKVPLRILKERILRNEKRPSLIKGKTAADELGEIWLRRKNIYKKVADFVFKADNKPAKIQAENLWKKLKNLKSSLSGQEFPD